MADTDPWVEAAKNFKPSGDSGSAPASSGNEDWKIWQQGGGSPAGDSGNFIQQRIDSAINTPSVSGPRSLDSFGRGAAQAMLSPIAHPVEAGKGLVKALQPDPGVAGLAEGAIGGPAGPLIAHTVKGLYDDYRQNGLSHALGNVAGGIIGGEATGGLVRGAAGVAGKALTSGAAKLDNMAIGTTAGDVSHGADPGAALSQNRIWGTSPNRLLSKVNTKIPGAVAENRSVLANANPNIRINSGPLVSQPFDDAIQSATNPKTGAALPAQIAKTVKTQRSLTHVMDPATGRITDAARDPYLTPLEAAQLKSNIYNMTDYDNPSRSTFANSGLKGAARNLKTSIEENVPESKPSGQRLHNLMSAKDVLTPKAEGTHFIPASKEGLISRALTGASTGGAALMDATGDSATSLERILRTPLLAPGAGAATSGVSSKRGNR